MNSELSFEYRILGGSAYDALMSIKRIDKVKDLESLISHEKNRMNRKSVLKALEARLRKVRRQKVGT